MRSHHWASPKTHVQLFYWVKTMPNCACPTIGQASPRKLPGGQAAKYHGRSAGSRNCSRSAALSKHLDRLLLVMIMPEAISHSPKPSDEFQDWRIHFDPDAGMMRGMRATRPTLAASAASARANSAQAREDYATRCSRLSRSERYQSRKAWRYASQAKPIDSHQRDALQQAVARVARARASGSMARSMMLRAWTTRLCICCIFAHSATRGHGGGGSRGRGVDAEGRTRLADDFGAVLGKGTIHGQQVVASCMYRTTDVRKFLR